MTELISILTLIPFRIRVLDILRGHGFCLHLLVICLSIQAPASCGKNIKNLQLLPGRGLLPLLSLLIPKITATSGSLEQRSPHVPATSSQNSTDDGNMGPKKQNLFSSPCVFANDWKNRLKRMSNSAKLWMAGNEQFLAQAMNSRSDSCKLG